MAEVVDSGFRRILEPLFQRIPAVDRPIKHVHFRSKIFWTLIILLLYFFLANVPVWGLSAESQDIFGAFRAIMAGSSGTLMALGIGPIVMASIVLQLLVGAKVLKIDTSDPRDQAYYQGLQKMLVLVMIVLETLPQIFSGYLIPDAELATQLGVSSGVLMFVIFLQYCLGGLLIMFMDEVVSKWGIGSGVSIFIVAGISQALVQGVIFWSPPYLAESLAIGNATVAPNLPVGIMFKWPYIFENYPGDLLGGDGLLYLFTQGDILALFATIGIFLMVVYFEGTRIEIPLAHSIVRGARGKFPVKLIYASVLPMILVMMLQANVQLVGGMITGGQGSSWLATYDIYGNPVDGLLYYLNPLTGPQDWLLPLLGSSSYEFSALQVIVHVVANAIILIGGGIVFAIFWVNTTGMGAESVARQIQRSGMQIPGFRRSPQIIERVVGRYIPRVTVLGGALIGLLTLIASLFGILGGVGGTGMLLTVSILHQLYEQLAKEQMMEMHPVLRRFLGGAV